MFKRDKFFNWHVHRHNAAYGRVIRGRTFLQSLQTEPSLTHDAISFLTIANMYLRKAEQEIKMRRVEPDGTVTAVYTFENGDLVKVGGDR